MIEKRQAVRSNLAALADFNLTSAGEFAPPRTLNHTDLPPATKFLTNKRRINCVLITHELRTWVPNE